MKNILQLINEEVIKNPKTCVFECEKSYRDEIFSVAKAIADNDDIKIVALAGPSSSGKTTTAHILKKMLIELEENVSVISLDDFYLPCDKLPVLSDGKPDIESVNSLDLELLEKCFNEIVKLGKTVIPHFDFEKKQRFENYETIDTGDRGIVIVEGLHALNPLITGNVDKKNIYKIYISINKPILDISGNEIISSRKIRLIRRTLRDETFRASDVNATLSLWNNVIIGETKYLYCFKKDADVCISTLHPYELCLYKNRFSALKDSVNKGTPCYDLFVEAQDAIEKFVSLDSSFIPDDSLLKEFIV